jgi:hypothetical protein
VVRAHPVRKDFGERHAGWKKTATPSHPDRDSRHGRNLLRNGTGGQKQPSVTQIVHGIKEGLWRRSIDIVRREVIVAAGGIGGVLLKGHLSQCNGPFSLAAGFDHAVGAGKHFTNDESNGRKNQYGQHRFNGGESFPRREAYTVRPKGPIDGRREAL